MTASPVTASEDTPVEEAARTMLDQGFRHLPVMADERPVGIVSIRDLARWSIDEQPAGEDS
jgi:CBS domain-containing protein